MSADLSSALLPRSVPGAAAWEGVGIVSVPRPDHGLSDHDYLWHLAQVGEQSGLSKWGKRKAEEAATEEARAELLDRREERRSAAYERQRDLSPLYPSVMRKCRRVQVSRKGTSGAPVEIIVRQDGTAGFSGLVSCNRRSGCEHCGPRMLTRDAELIRAVVEAHGYERSAMLTLTFRHHQGQDLKMLRRGLSASWRRMLAHRDWRTRDALVGVRVIRALEVTLGEHGWHPHLHVILMFRAPPNPLALDTLEALVARLWRETVVRVMGSAHVPTLSHGVSLEPCHKADYLAKLGLEWEVAAAGTGKRARGVKGRAYPQIARDWIADGCDEASADAGAIRGYLAGMHGAKVITWSPGAKAAAELLAPREEVLERERASLHPEEWRAVRDMLTPWGTDARAAILGACESAAPGFVQQELDALVTLLLERGRPPGGLPFQAWPKSPGVRPALLE